MDTDFKERTPGSVAQLLASEEKPQSAARQAGTDLLRRGQDCLAEENRSPDPATRLALVVDRLRRETDPETTRCLVLQAEELRHLVREEVRRFARASVQRHRTRTEPGGSEQAVASHT